jgi:hypothetical protein
MKVDVKGGTVYLRDRLDYPSGHAIRFALAVASEELKASYGVTDGNIPDEAVPDLMATISLHEILRGVERWSFKEPVTRQNIHALILDDPDRSMVVGVAADRLYQDQVIGPLTSAAASSSPPSPTDEPTSAQNGSSSTSEGGPIASIPSPKPRKRSKPSSTSTTQTGVTVTTSA